MKEMYFTIAGCNHYYGSDFMEKGMKVKLVKEPDNEPLPYWSSKCVGIHEV